MDAIAGSRTEQHLLAAFLGESADHNRYVYYAKVANKAGYIALATAFQETALQEQSHAKNFLKHLGTGNLTITSTFNVGGLGTNMENLIQSVAGETHQFETLYPGFAETAKAEGFPKVAALFSSIAKAEQYHARRFQSFIDAIENDTMFTDTATVTWVCAKCGYIHRGTRALDICPACGHPKAYFERTSIL